MHLDCFFGAGVCEGGGARAPPCSTEKEGTGNQGNRPMTGPTRTTASSLRNSRAGHRFPVLFSSCPRRKKNLKTVIPTEPFTPNAYVDSASRKYLQVKEDPRIGGDGGQAGRH